jgi:hypothetical protein
VLEVVEYVPPSSLDKPAAAGGDRAQPAGSAMAPLEAEVRGVRARGVGVQVIVRSGDPAPRLLEVADAWARPWWWSGPAAVAGRTSCCWAASAGRWRTARRPTLVPAAAGPAHLCRAAEARHLGHL